MNSVVSSLLDRGYNICKWWSLGDIKRVDFCIVEPEWSLELPRNSGRLIKANARYYRWLDHGWIRCWIISTLHGTPNRRMGRVLQPTALRTVACPLQSIILTVWNKSTASQRSFVLLCPERTIYGELLCVESTLFLSANAMVIPDISGTTLRHVGSLVYILKMDNYTIPWILAKAL